MKCVLLLCAVLGVATPSAATAGEIFGGLYVHDVDTPLSKSGVEGGADVQLGWRGGRIGKTPLQPYVFGALNSAGEHLAVHSGSARNFEDPENGEIDFGSRILFAPEVALGTRVSDRLTIEASWIHMSHGQLFGRQNPGTDHFGLRLSYGL